MRRFIVLICAVVVTWGGAGCSDTVTSINAPSPSEAPAVGASPFVNSGSAGGGAAQSGSGSSISTMRVVLVTDANTNGLPDRGDSIMFTISTTQRWNQVSVVCSQDGTVVLRAVRTPSAWSAVTLTSQAWQAGSADCEATLDQFNGTKVMTLAVATFTAGA